MPEPELPVIDTASFQELKQQFETLKEQNLKLAADLQSQKASNSHSAQESHLMQNNLDSVQPVNIKTPPFSPDDPELWFDQLEAQFAVHRIKSEKNKFSHAISQLEGRYAREVKDIIKAPPDEKPYTELKTKLINRLSASEAQRVRQLLGQEELNGRTPSQFLRHLRSLAGSITIQDKILLNLWLQRLPTQIQAILQAHIGTLNIDQLADLADRISEVASTPPSFPAVHAASAPPPQPRETTQQELAQAIENLTRQFETLQKRQFEAFRDELRNTMRHRSPSRGRQRYRDRSYSRDRSLSRQRQPLSDPPEGTCWYHHNFGKKARKCNQPCSYSTNTTGSR